MKKIIGALLALITSAAFATTTVPIQLITPIAANTVVANATGSTATPTAFAVPSCSATGNALNWATSTGFTCNTTLFSSPTITTPNITGVTNGGNATAGSVGEYASGTLSAVSLTSVTAANCASVTLTAGDWDVSGTIEYDPAATTVISAIHASLNTTSATLNTTIGFDNSLQISAGFGTNLIQRISTPVVRYNVSGSTPVYLVGQSTFTTSTATCTGLIRARRVR